MKYFAYVRVSTARQGEKGVSLEQQRAAIESHAERNSLTIVEWYEERRTAATQGRPIFTQMLRELKRAKAQGVIIHKVDRSARNLRDWSQMAELLDSGISVQIASDSLDLTTRGGRLSADIQAVVAADYIRNLREEARKGIDGRLKQGLFPFPAPLGYVDRGEGKPKEIDPVAGPLVRQLFDLYATGRYSLDRLVEEAHRLGLRNRVGNRVSKNSLSALLNNPFYTGIIRIKRTGTSYPGKHEPLITARRFKDVQQVLQGKTIARSTTHEFVFRRMIRCSNCGYSIVGERQKGITYYRCHSKICPQTCVREDFIEEAVERILRPLQLSPDEKRFIDQKISKMGADDAEHQKRSTAAIELQVRQIDSRLNRLTDAYVDGSIEKEVFDRRHAALLLDRRQLQDQLARYGDGLPIADHLRKFFERLESAYLRYKEGLVEEKREILKIVTSNLSVEGKKLIVERKSPLDRIANRSKTIRGGAERDVARIWSGVLPEIRASLVDGEIVLSSAWRNGGAPKLELW